jgi:hypothetical protein
VKFVRPILLPALVLSLASCNLLSRSTVSSQDCTVPKIPAGFTRIFIGLPTHGGQMSGTSADDPLDGSTSDKFDTILRTIAEGQLPTWGTQKNIPPENLIVCMTSGTFQTNGQYDWVIDVGHALGSPRGFTVEKNWKVHGRGPDQTKLQLASYLTDRLIDNNRSSFNSGRNLVIGTHSDNASGIEISDLTIDANHDQLTPVNGLPLNLEGIVLRSIEGNHWIHNVKIIGASGDAGAINILYEGFAVQIWGSDPLADPNASSGNLVENVTVSQPGRPMTSNSPPGGAMDGIVVNGASAEIRNNNVENYGIAYGGWAMGNVFFHDNIAHDCVYGFNADSFSNNGITLQSNQFIHPTRYGIVIGGGGSNSTFSNWNVSKNTIQLNTEGAAGIILQGQIQHSIFAQNTIQSDGIHHTYALYSYPFAPGLFNFENSFQDNHIDKSMSIDFSRDPNFSTNCRYQNRDLQGQPIPSFPDNSSNQCN